MHPHGLLVLCAIVRKGNIKGTTFFLNNYVLDCHVCTRMDLLVLCAIVRKGNIKGTTFLK